LGSVRAKNCVLGEVDDSELGVASDPSIQDKADSVGAAELGARATSARANPSRLQVHTAKQLVTLIRRDELQPGYHLREEALAQRLGVSRTSVRAGLRILHERGLLTARQNRGYTLAVESTSAKISLDLPTSADESLYMRIVRDRIAKG
jgi:biotin operon repressor